MKDLRTRLNKIAAEQPVPSVRAVRQPMHDERICFVRETAVPLAEIFGDRLPGGSGMGRIDSGFTQRCVAQGGLPAPTELLFLDTETTGLGMGAGTVAFLLGLGWVEGDAFIVRQLMMRDYPEEPLVMQAFADLLPRFRAFVSYNGKSFDVPLLENRLTMCRMRVNMQYPHLDLLHAARRVWKMRLSDCRLGNIEEQVLGCGRNDDLPGSEVPERYFSYLKTGDFSLLEDVLHHNLLDIQTLGRLLARLEQVFYAPEQQRFEEDVFSAGRALDRSGERALARVCFRVAGTGKLAVQARAQLANSHRRDREYREATSVYQEMVTRGEGGITPYVELAKLAEHRLRDLERALGYTEAALARLDLRERLGGANDAEARSALHLRRARLLRKIQARAR